MKYTLDKLVSLVSHTEWSNISEKNSKLIGNLKKWPELFPANSQLVNATPFLI